MKSFQELISEKVSTNLHILGDFAANYILDNQQELIQDTKVIDWKYISKMVFEAFYNEGGEDPPEWINYLVQETQLEDSKEESDLILRGLFINNVNEAYNKNHRSIDYATRMEMSNRIEVSNLPFSHRLNFCLEYRLIPFLNRGVIDSNTECIVLTSDLMHELRRQNLESAIPSLVEIAKIIPGFEYGQKKLGKKNVRAAYGHKLQFLEFLTLNKKLHFISFLR
jgi:hypothetical protein